MPQPAIYVSIQRFKNSLLAAEAESAGRLVNSYGRIYRGLSDQVRALEADIADLGDKPTRGQVVRLDRYKSLLGQTADEMDRYGAVLDHEVSGLRARAIADATAQSQTLVRLALPDLPPSVAKRLLAQFNRLPTEAVETMLGALAKDSPLAALLADYGDAAALDLGNTILDGVALGYNPKKIAAQMQRAMGGNLTRALTISRTETLRAYRTASLANYAANSDVVKGWRWMATKGTNPPPCLACLALDGREFKGEQFFQAHPN